MVAGVTMTYAEEAIGLVRAAVAAGIPVVIGGWLDRIAGLRANASAKSHAELDEAEVLDEGDPAGLGADYAALRPSLRNVSVLGGCCGTDERHVAAVGAAWLQ
jgi:S-methylmethionine-dependent homocysteine/selenocysteine methylase